MIFFKLTKSFVYLHFYAFSKNWFNFEIYIKLRQINYGFVVNIIYKHNLTQNMENAAINRTIRNKIHYDMTQHTLN